MTEDELVYEGLDFIKAHPTATARRVEEFLWAEIDGHNRESHEDNARLMHEGVGFLLVRWIRHASYGGRMRRAMTELRIHMDTERRRAKRRRETGDDRR